MFSGQSKWWPEGAGLAEQHGCSLKGEVKALLESAAPQFTAAEALAIAEKWRKHWGDRRFDDSTDLIREDRDR